MKRFLAFLLISTMGLISPAFAQTAIGFVNPAGTGTTLVSSANPLPTTGSATLPAGAATSARQVLGGTAGSPSSEVQTIQGAPSMTPLQVAGVTTTAPNSSTNPVAVSFYGSSGTKLDAASTSADISLTSATGASAGVIVNAVTRLQTSTASTGTNAVDATKADGTGKGVLAAALAPSSVATVAPSNCIAQGVSTLQCKNGAGNLYSVALTATADSWLAVFNATTAPTTGATTAGTASGNLMFCIKVPTGTTASIGNGVVPIGQFSAGIYVAISSTACASITLATTGMIMGAYK